ncbi:hypothetical protein POTOM_029347 [Populus tomentosa]|uniref:DDE Tnp4 domain-containing protein n=1 Tax=Populus tomentosa TaxID=118781 RepID=A0A8X7ZA35_POPTO|nr:hypothetical protein POTOM_029347 [Populus tomentosa]
MILVHVKLLAHGQNYVQLALLTVDVFSIYLSLLLYHVFDSVLLEHATVGTSVHLANWPKNLMSPSSESNNSKKFESFFKISRKTFNYICSLVKEDLKARQSNFTGSNGKPLSVTDQVAVALRRLSSGESLSNIGDLLGINQSTVSQITWRFVEAMEERGLHHLCWPSTEAEMEEIKSNFEKICGLPNCCGSIDTTHIVMTLPTVDRSNDVWIDREKNHSMLLQAIVDPDMRFRDVIVGYPGSLSDALVLQNSSFFKLSEEGKRLNGKKIELQEGMELGEYIIGDSGFPLLSWLLTPYQNALSDHQAEFNKRHSETQVVAQIALARLKEMWRIIHGVMWLPDKNRLPRIIFVCCLLHNIVIDMEDKGVDELPSSHQHDTDYRQQICETVNKTGIATELDALCLICLTKALVNPVMFIPIGLLFCRRQNSLNCKPCLGAPESLWILLSCVERDNKSEKTRTPTPTTNPLPPPTRIKTPEEPLGFKLFGTMINKLEAKKLLKDKRLWFASFLIAWAAALQRQDSFKQKFGTLNEDNSDVAQE